METLILIAHPGTQKIMAPMQEFLPKFSVQNNSCGDYYFFRNQLYSNPIENQWVWASMSEVFRHKSHHDSGIGEASVSGCEAKNGAPMK